MVWAALLSAAPAVADPGPSVAELQRRAVRAAGVAPERLAAMRRRLRLSALAPTLHLRGGLGATDLVLLSPYDGTAHIDRGDTWRVDATLSWSFERLAWQPAELALEREAQRQAERRELVATEVAQIYFERRGLQRALATGALADEERAEAAVRVEELSAILDALTGGAAR
jgi:hypothetical protein